LWRDRTQLPIGEKSDSLDPFERIFLIEFNIEFLQQTEIFIPERLPGVMGVLIQDVSRHCIDLGP